MSTPAKKQEPVTLKELANRDHSKSAYITKKVEDARAFFEKNGVPDIKKILKKK